MSMGFIKNENQPIMSQQECVEALTNLGVPIYYEPRVHWIDRCGFGTENLSVFEMVDKLGLHKVNNNLKS